MMYLKYFFYILIFFSSLTCKENLTIYTESNKLFGKVEVRWRPYFVNPSDRIAKESISFSGEIIPESIATIERIIVDEDTIPFYYRTPEDDRYNGLIKFESSNDYFPLNFQNREIKIETTIGVLRGLIQIPDSVRNIHYSVSDTIDINEPLIMSFDGNAKYYNLYYSIGTLSFDSSIYYQYYNLLSKNSQFILDSLPQASASSLSIISVTNYNGPYPEKGSNGNMYGDGTGFLHSYRKQSILKFFTIKNNP